MVNFNQLTPGEAERLAILLEELGEAQQVIGKILRHGYESCHPEGTETNRNALERELGDVSFAMFFMGYKNDIDPEAIKYYSDKKLLRINQFLHHNEIETYGE